MKLYVVREAHCCGEPAGVFSTEEKALAFVAQSDPDWALLIEVATLDDFDAVGGTRKTIVRYPDECPRGADAGVNRCIRGDRVFCEQHMAAEGKR